MGSCTHVLAKLMHPKDISRPTSTNEPGSKLG